MDDECFMREALAEATRAGTAGDIPVGAVAVYEDRVIARARNEREVKRDPIAHAEMSVIGDSARVLGDWRLTGVTIYCTMEPCPMCAGAIVQARVSRLVYAVEDPKAGAAGSIVNLVQNDRLNHRVQVRAGVLETEVKNLMDDYFKALRGGRVRRWSRRPRRTGAQT